MACVRNRRGHWRLDYHDQQGCRHWETTKGNRKEAERPAELGAPGICRTRSARSGARSPIGSGPWCFAQVVAEW